MGRFTLEELECDEIHAALVERRADLAKRAEKLIADGLPEAAAGVRVRLTLYDAHEGPDQKTRAGLVRMFAPQRDIESEVEQKRRGEQRDGNGEQDLFGGGAETGGRPRSAKATTPPPDDIPDVEYEIIPEGRRIAARSTLTIETALRVLAHMARHLLAGPSQLAEAEYDHYAGMVVAALPSMHPTIDPEYLRAHVMDELRAAADNAHALAHFLERNVDQIRDLRDNPPAPKSDTPAPLAFVELTAEERDALEPDERTEYDAELAEHKAAQEKAGELATVVAVDEPLEAAAAEALKGYTFAPEPEPETGRDVDGGLSFETPGATEGADGATEPGSDATKPAGGATEPPTEGDGKGKKKGRGKGRGGKKPDAGK